MKTETNSPQRTQRTEKGLMGNDKARAVKGIFVVIAAAVLTGTILVGCAEIAERILTGPEERPSALRPRAQGQVAVSGEPSAVSRQPSAVGRQPSAIPKVETSVAEFVVTAAEKGILNTGWVSLGTAVAGAGLTWLLRQRRVLKERGVSVGQTATIQALEDKYKDPANGKITITEEDLRKLLSQKYQEAGIARKTARAMIDRNKDLIKNDD